MLTKDPNPAHLAIAECEERLGKQGRTVTVITQNIDELHQRAGSKNILELHGKKPTVQFKESRSWIKMWLFPEERPHTVSSSWVRIWLFCEPNLTYCIIKPDFFPSVL